MPDTGNVAVSPTNCLECLGAAVEGQWEHISPCASLQHLACVDQPERMLR